MPMSVSGTSEESKQREAFTSSSHWRLYVLADSSRRK
jgi:hypothetical protein